MLAKNCATLANRPRLVETFGLRLFAVVAIVYLLGESFVITPASAQTYNNCSTRWCYETVESQLPDTCGPPETFVHHSTVYSDHDPFQTPAPPIDITFTGGRITWWGTYAYGTTVQASYNHTPCYTTQISMQISQTAESVTVSIGNGYTFVSGSPPVPLTVTDNLGRTQIFDMYSYATVVMQGGGITTLTFSTPNVPFFVDSFYFDPQCSVNSMDLVAINSPLDPNPNLGGGQRIFPDNLTASDTINRRIARVRAATNFGQNVPVYFRAFDIDDPSTDAAPVDPNGSAGVDNRGTPQAGTLSAASVQTDANGVAQVDFTVSMQPGDNFVIAASRDQAYLNALVIDGINLRDSNNVQLPTSKARATQMLTVWRRVHIEVDSMGLVSGNQVTGRTSSVTPNPSANTTVVAAGNTANLELNRFQNGRMVLTNVGSYAIVSNTATSVTVQGIINSVPHNTNYTLYDDDDFNNNNGTTLIGDIGENVSAPDTSLIQDSDSPALNVFAAAYVRPTYDIGDNNDLVSFKLNMDTTSATTIIANYDFDAIATQADANFWTVYLLGAYQGRTTEDHDPVTDSAIVGIVDNLNGQGANVFNEVIRPPESTNTGVVNNAATTAHEIGHLFNGQHSDGNGLMAQSINRTSITFDPTTLNTIRSITHP